MVRLPRPQKLEGVFGPSKAVVGMLMALSIVALILIGTWSCCFSRARFHASGGRPGAAARNLGSGAKIPDEVGDGSDPLLNRVDFPGSRRLARRLALALRT